MTKIYYEGAWKELKKTLPKLDELYHDIARCVLASIKDKMHDLEEKHKTIDVYMEYIEVEKSGFIRKGNNIQSISNEFTINEIMNIEEYECYHNAIMEGKIVNYKEKKIRVTKLTIPDF